MTIMTMHGYFKNHLESVIQTAQNIGSVRIKGYFDGETIFCLEGVHRVEAAKRLRLPLIIDTVSLDDKIYTDCEDVEQDSDGMATVSDLFDYAYGGSLSQVNIYNDDDFEEVDLR